MTGNPHHGKHHSSKEVPDVVEQQKHGNNDGLADLESVDSSEDVDGVGTEDADRRHVQVVHEAKVDRVGRESKPVSEHVGDQNGGDSEIDVVDNQQRDRRNCRQKELVAPSDVKQVVHESEQDHRLQTKQTTEIG
ncbi:hypothetical protein OGAPHI_001619 [Ogataea philodendri]|uniref:Uncharacterized protein n=1 Tax=Ogataea philodendri TaxID=1378263 RepID=A0A9P8T7S2_9ASCO|nr:uncharacterized protein OGAPHI_001619 [Ogataea philodendri]KAH3669498.1 hypothetical protein OGAPHI_001619 [Ogataea philodendri]